MPELAEVEYFRKRWDPALGESILTVHLNEKSGVFRGLKSKLLSQSLPGTRFLASEAAAKQMLFTFSDDHWLGLHLGMTGELRCETAAYKPARHDHLVLFTSKHALVFNDHRMFGRVQFHHGKEAPDWWSSIAPAILSDAFTAGAMHFFLQRRARSPIKSVLLMQQQFPGIGNWMADEVLWRAEIHPKKPAGKLSEEEEKSLYRQLRWVCREALKIIGKDYSDPPKSWLFSHRWEDGGVCPRTGAPLVREDIGGRTTCWSPALQTL